MALGAGLCCQMDNYLPFAISRGREPGSRPEHELSLHAAINLGGAPDQ